MKHSQKSHATAGYLNMTVVLFTFLCVLICGSLALSLKAQTKTSDEHVTPKTVRVRNGKIAFTTGNIYTTEADGGNVQRLTDSPRYDHSPIWSPDGTRIAFVSRLNNNNEIYVMNADGSGQTRLTNNPADDYSPIFSPDGTRIAFVSRLNNSNDIYVMNADGTNQIRLTNGPEGHYSPAWSPDGSRIAFGRGGLIGYILILHIYVMNADGTNQTRLTNDPAGDYLHAWSPDGSRIAFKRGGHIYVMNADGSNQTRLTDRASSFYDSLDWSPDGSRIAFGSDPDNNNSEIYVMNADGSHQTRLTNNPAYDRSPIFSPDGTRIAFLSDRDKIENDWSYNDKIYVMNADGTGQTRLTNTADELDESKPDWHALPSPSCPNPIDCAEFFVRQHYLDFLNREPDPAGYAGWQATLNNCSAGDITCDRIHVSSAFFRSPEFQGRGYFVYRFYPVSFGRKPDYDEFRPDLAKVSGFLSDAELETAKQTFIAEFTNRPPFVSKFTGLSDTEYVDSLLSSADITHSSRDSWVAALTTGSRTRAEVLREIAESTEVYNKYYNQAFVVMQYFGYLRRQPDALYLTWIAHLDSTGDYRSMTHGFMNSIEFRARFGQP